jgi:hypothetical protein
MIRKQLMRRYQLKRDGISKLKGKMCPRIVEKLGLKGRCGLCKVWTQHQDLSKEEGESI